MNEFSSLFLSSGYFVLVYISIILAFAAVLFGLFQKLCSKTETIFAKITAKIKKRIEAKKSMTNTATKATRAFYFIIFLPLATPLIKCWFKLPFIFCRACPRKCAFGELRPFVVPSFLLLNLDKRFWCYKLCPCGAVQDYQSRVCKRRVKLPEWLAKWLGYIRYLFLLLAAISVLALILNEGFKAPFFIGAYKFVIGTLVASSLILILCFFIPRFWCNYICPVGCVGDLTLKSGA